MRLEPAFGEYTEKPEPILPPGLAEHVTPEKLSENAMNYPEMRLELSDIDAEKVGRIKATLLELPLVHSTNRTEDELRSVGILPHSQKPGQYVGNSGTLDASLGLTDCTFMNWGVAEKSTSHGVNHQLIKTDLLLDPRTIVTPRDIMSPLRWSAGDKPFEEQPADVREVIGREYFDKIVSGTDWLEITSRKILSGLKSGDISLVSVDGDTALGEIKYFGAIDPGRFGGYISPAGERAYWRWQLDHGFLPGPVMRSFPRPGSSYDVSPEQLGTSLDAAQGFWKRILDVEIQ